MVKATLVYDTRMAKIRLWFAIRVVYVASWLENAYLLPEGSAESVSRSLGRWAAKAVKVKVK